jgi:hypothetical protein
MERRYKAIVTGPKEYLPGGVLMEEFVITQEDINEYLSEDDSETEEDAINYYKEEYIAEWAQRWCNVQLINKYEVTSDYDYDDPNGGHNGQRFSPDKNELPLFDDDDGEEEEEEEDEWKDWK